MADRQSCPELVEGGSRYTARETRRFAREINLRPRTPPIESPQSNGMAEAFVRTMKRNYVRVAEKPDARAVINQLPRWFHHYNTVHPHRALGYLGPREYITQSTSEELSGNQGQRHFELRCLHTKPPRPAKDVYSGQI